MSKPEHLAIWEALGKTDPAHTKQFQRAGGFKGTAIKPMWANKRMTEFFGPCGIGWGMDKPEYQLVPADGELMVYCTVEMWYRHDPDSTARVFGVGGDKVITRGKDGFRTDDEAFKKAFTDALGNAMKFIGVGADVHMGQFEDSKYVQEVRQEFEVERQKGSQAPQDVPQGIPPVSEVVIPPEPSSSFNKGSGLLIAHIVDVVKKFARNGRDYLILQFDVELEKGKKPIAFYWHETHRDALLAAKGKMVKALVEFDGKGFRVESVTEIDYHKLEPTQASPETQARLLASTLDMTEEQLLHNVSLCKGKWQDALEFLQREKARREVTA